MYAMQPITTLLSSGLHTSKELFEGHKKVRFWYEKVLDEPSFERGNTQGAEELGNAFQDALRDYENFKYPEINLENYKDLNMELLLRFDPKEKIEIIEPELVDLSPLIEYEDITQPKLQTTSWARGCHVRFSKHKLH